MVQVKTAVLRTAAALFLTAIAAPAPTDGKRADGSAEEEGVEARVEGARLRYMPRWIPLRRRTPEGELAHLESAGATLELERSVRYRDGHAAAGTYAVRVEASEDGRYVLVLDRIATPRGSRVSNATKRGSPSGRAETTAGSRATASVKPRERSDGKATELEALRVPLSLAPIEDADHIVRFSLAVDRKGTRLRLHVRAGSTVAQAVLRYGDDEAPRGSGGESDDASRDEGGETSRGP